MRMFVTTHARLSFWCAMVPGFVFLIWGLTRFGSEAGLWLYAIFVVWTVAAFVLINRQAWRLCRPALETLDRDCDPEPLLDLCRTVLGQNPDSLYFRVYEGHALALLGREEEALQAAKRAEVNPRLWKDPALLLVWSASIPAEDTRQERAVQALEKLRRRMTPQGQAVLDQTLARRQALALLSQVTPELGESLKEQLDQASCARERVAAHLALGACYAVRKDLAAEEHLQYVLDHANKLHGARYHAERLLCLLPARD